jgi:hypothetical protein
MYTSKMLMRIVERGEHGINMCCRTVFCTVLTSCVAGPFKIFAKIVDNAYKLELPPEFGVSPNFNISDLRPYLGEEDEMLPRMTLM